MFCDVCTDAPPVARMIHSTRAWDYCRRCVTEIASRKVETASSHPRRRSSTPVTPLKIDPTSPSCAPPASFAWSPPRLTASLNSCLACVRAFPPFRKTWFSAVIRTPNSMSPPRIGIVWLAASVLDVREEDGAVHRSTDRHVEAGLERGRHLVPGARDRREGADQN